MDDQFDPTQFGAVAVSEPPFDPTQHGAVPVQEPPQQSSGIGGFVSGVGSSLYDAVKGLLPTSTEQVAELATPLVGSVKHVVETGQKLSHIAFGGKTFAEEFPQGKTYPEFTAADYGKLIGQVGVGAAQALLIHKGLTAPLAETAGIAKPDIAQPSEPVATDEVTAETVQPTEKITQSAFKLSNGEVVGTGPFHQGEFPQGSQAGFQTTLRPFVSRDEAGQIATGLRQPLFAEDFVTNHDIVPSLLEHPIASDAIAAGAQKGVPPFTEQPVAQPVQEAVTPPTAAPQLPLVEPEPVVQTGATGTGESLTVDQRAGGIWDKMTSGERFRHLAGMNPLEVALDRKRYVSTSNKSWSDLHGGNKDILANTLLYEETPSIPSATEPTTAPLSTTTGEPNAIQEQSPSSVLQHPQETVGEAGGGRVGVESGQQGQEVASPVEAETQITSSVPKTEENAVTPETPATGVHAAALEERPINAPPPGEVVGWEANRESGHQWLDAGGDPNEIIQKFADTKAVTPEDMGRMSAALQRLQAGTDAAGDALRKDPSNPELQTAYQTAKDAEQRFTDTFKPMHTFASANLASLQGKIPFDEDAAKSFTGMQREFQANMGREFKPEEAIKADKLVEKNTEAGQKYQAANEELFKTVDKEMEKVPSKVRGRAPTIKELGEMFSEKLREVCDV